MADVSYEKAIEGLIAHRRDHPGVYLEPGHIVQQVRVARHRYQEIHGIHPQPPAGQRWAVDVIESMPDADLPELRA